MSKPIIEVQNLSKRYHLGRVGATTLREDLGRLASRLRGRTEIDGPSDFWALRDVSFTVQPGEVLGVIGRNGAGKSTLLKILSRITEPTSGRAILRGRVASLLEVGTGFHPDLTGRENVFLNGAILGMKNAEIAARFDEIVAFAEVNKFIDTPVKHYSSGMRVRLAFAVAAHLNSEIMIADEVLAVGDSAFQEKCLGKMRDVSARQGRTVLFVSHHTSSIRMLCPTVLWMENGMPKMMGPTGKVLEKYLESSNPQTRSPAFGAPVTIPPDHPASIGKTLRLRSVNLRTPVSHGSEKSYSVLTPLDIQLVVEVEKESVDAFVVLSIWHEGICAFSHPSPISHLQSGCHRYVAHIPGKLLNHETYAINVYIKSKNDESYYENVVRFKPADDGKPHHVEFDKWAGVLRPEIAWSQEKL